jgi:hypothetical protein
VIPIVAMLLLIQALPVWSQPQKGVGVTGASPVSALPAKAKRWALLIGVDRYDDSQISSLSGAANDARSLREALVSSAGFPADQVLVLATGEPPERQPTRVNILRRLSNLASVVPHDGLLLIAFSGHGIERQGQAFLLPSDASLSNDVSLLEETAVSLVRMKERIARTHVEQVLLLLDACRNDPGGRADAPNRLTPAFTRAFNFDVRNREVAAFATIYATGVGERAFEYSEKHQGYFTWAVVDALRGAAANDRGEVTLSGLVSYVQNTVPKRVAVDLGGGHEQRPFATIDGYRADELVIAVAGPAPISMQAAAQPLSDRALDTEFWKSVDSNDPRQIRAYLGRYPNGFYSEVAIAKLERLEAHVPQSGEVSPSTRPTAASPTPAIALPTSGGSPRLKIVEPVKEMGTVAKGERLNWTFSIINGGSGDLQILSAKPGCGCTVVDFDKVIGPGQTGKVSAHVDTTAFAGPIAKLVTLETNDPDLPTAQLTLRAIVKPYVEAYPAGFVRFNVEWGQEETQSVTLYSEEDIPLEVIRIEVPVDWISATFRRIDGGERAPSVGKEGQTQYRINLTIRRNAQIGPLAEKVHIITNSRHQPDYYISITGVVRKKP